MRKKLMIVLLCVVVLFTSVPSLTLAKAAEPVIILDKGSHYEITLDYSSGLSPYEMGAEYGKKILEAVPEYETLFDSYLAEIIGDEFIYNVFLARVEDIKPQVREQYKDEIDGIASQLSGGSQNVMGDNKLSKDELYIINLLPDVARMTQCSAFSVFGKRSEYPHKAMLYRALDWYQGSQNQIVKIQAVQTIKNGKKSICTIGYIGYMGVLTAINDDKLFAAILDSSTGAPYVSESKSSYPFDIRYALENFDKLYDVSAYLKSDDREYTFSHNIFLSDTNKSIVLENNAGTDGEGLREERSKNSVLNDGVGWEISDSIGCVNSFILEGNTDNHTADIVNTSRWESMKTQAAAKGSKITLRELKEIASFNHGDGPDGMEDGDLYNNMTQQLIVFIPFKMQLEVFFRPDAAELPNQPTFEKIQVKF